MVLGAIALLWLGSILFPCAVLGPRWWQLRWRLLRPGVLELTLAGRRVVLSRHLAVHVGRSPAVAFPVGRGGFLETWAGRVRSFYPALAASTCSGTALVLPIVRGSSWLGNGLFAGALRGELFSTM